MSKHTKINPDAAAYLQQLSTASALANERLTAVANAVDADGFGHLAVDCLVRRELIAAGRAYKEIVIHYARAVALALEMTLASRPVTVADLERQSVNGRRKPEHWFAGCPAIPLLQRDTGDAEMNRRIAGAYYALRRVRQAADEVVVAGGAVADEIRFDWLLDDESAESWAATGEAPADALSPTVRSAQPLWHRLEDWADEVVIAAVHGQI